MAYENNERKADSVYSARVKAGKRRTYFFDVRETRGSDFYITITESCKRFDSDGYDRHKIFLYKEDFNKFIQGLNDTIEHVKTNLMPDFDFDTFNHNTPYEGEGIESEYQNDSLPTSNDTPETTEEDHITPASTYDHNADNGSNEEVDKW